MSKEKNNRKPHVDNPSALRIDGMPATAFDLINKYGTYNIQPTSDTENMYPAIAQGYNDKIIQTDCDTQKAEKRGK